MMSMFGPTLAAVLATAQAQPQGRVESDVVRRSRRWQRQGRGRCPGRVLRAARGVSERRSCRGASQDRQRRKVQLGTSTAGTGAGQWRQLPGLFAGTSDRGRAVYAGSLPLVLQDPRPRTVKVEGPDGTPVAGARVAIRVLYAFGGTIADVPPSLADSLATTTGPDGTTSIDYLAARDQLVAVRVTADSIGSQDFLLVEQPGRASEPPVITIKLKSHRHDRRPGRRRGCPSPGGKGRRGLVKGRRKLAAAEPGRIQRWRAAHRCRRLFPNARQSSERIDLPADRSGEWQRADLLRLDHDPGEAAYLAALGAANVADHQRAGRRPKGETRRRCSSLPVGRRTGTHRDQDRH